MLMQVKWGEGGQSNGFTHVTLDILSYKNRKKKNGQVCEGEELWS